MTLKSTMTLSTYLKYLSIGFLMIMLLWFAMSIIAVFTNGFGINLDYMYCLILGFGTLLFFLYTIFDFSVISKMSPFLSVQDSSIVANYVWMFGFKLLIDLVMMVWYILLIIARFSR
jgi:FtsH-binding integral membrane protein